VFCHVIEKSLKAGKTNALGGVWSFSVATGFTMKQTTTEGKNRYSFGVFYRTYTCGFSKLQFHGPGA
jgi:hypothetical protein